jgi:hypothetical protein
MKQKRTAKRQLRGKGIVSDIYGWTAKLVTGEAPKEYNKLGAPNLNPNFGMSDPRLVVFNKAEGPGTNIIRAAKHVHRQDDAVTKISTIHDINYQLAKNNKDIRSADTTMLN